MAKDRIDRSIQLSTSTGEIPNTVKCVICGSQVMRTYLDFMISFNGFSVQALHAAGYLCINDQSEYISDEALLETYKKMVSIAWEAGRADLVVPAQERIRIQQRIMEKSSHKLSS